jgi:Icc-related predicted phosphoesterase
VHVQILLVSDVHYRLPQYDWLYAVAGEFDVVVVAGDLLDIRSAVAIAAQTVAVSAQMARISSRGTVLAASGNHDLDALDAHEEKFAGWLRRIDSDTLHVDDSSIVIDDTRFTVCGWWDGEQGRVALEQRLERDAQDRPRRWVWVYHSPPSGSPLAWDGRREFGDEQVLAWLDRFRPDMVLTGHIHQAPFVAGGGWVDQIGSTWLFNAGQQPGPVPAHVLIDLDAAVAHWITATERESVSLTEPFARRAAQ